MMCTLVDVLGMWMYRHIMGYRRISTPTDLGAAVREARTEDQLTQAELATRAGVSREWLIGLERGARPRAELTKILGVLSALDQPLMLGREESAVPPSKDRTPSNRGTGMSTAEVTRKAIERTREHIDVSTAPGEHPAPEHDRTAGTLASVSSLGASLQEITKLTGAMPHTDFTRHLASQLALMMPRTDLSSLVPTTDFSALLPKTDFSSLMPQPSEALLSLAQQLSALQRAEHAEDRTGVEHDDAAVENVESTSPEDDGTSQGTGADR